MYKLISWMTRLDRRVAMALILGIVLVFATIDYVTGFEISFAFFYLIPVGLAAWVVGRHFGVGISLLSAVTWHFANEWAGELFSHLWIHYWNTGTRLGFFIVVTLLLARLRGALERERILSRTDFLTGAYNRRAFYDLAGAELVRSRRYGRSFAVAYLDLDRFKQVNDELGHAVGDALLRTVVETMKAGLRASDVVARLGGDEFAILLHETDADGARQIMARLRIALLDAMQAHGWPVTFSMGVVIGSTGLASVTDLVHQADTLMYEVKSTSRDAISYMVMS